MSNCGGCKFFAGSNSPINCAVNPGSDGVNCYDYEEKEFIPSNGEFLLCEAPDGEPMLMELGDDEFSWIKGSLTKTAIWWLKKHDNSVINQWFELIA